MCTNSLAHQNRRFTAPTLSSLKILSRVLCIDNYKNNSVVHLFIIIVITQMFKGREQDPVVSFARARPYFLICKLSIVYIYAYKQTYVCNILYVRSHMYV